MNKRRYLAEFIGTFALVFAGCGAIIVNDLFPGTLGHVGVSMVFGLVVMSMIYAVGNVSGAHLNPAVTLGFLAAGRLEKKVVLPYVASQILGGIVAALFLKWMYPEHELLGATLPAVPEVKALVLEAVLTFLLMFVILNVSTGHMEKGIMAGVAVGAVIAMEALIAGPATGASMNPARSIAPALVSGHFESLWLYIAGPILGALLAFPTCRWVQGSSCCSDESDSDKNGE